MDFEMRLSGDGLDDLAVTSEELMEASAAVSGLVESVVEHAHQEQQTAQEGITTTTTTTSTSTTKVLMTAAEAGIAVDEETDDEVVHDLDDHEPQTQMLHNEEQEDGEVNEDDDDVEMDDFACTQVVVDEDEDPIDEDEEEAEAEAEMEDVAVESVEEHTTTKVAAVTSTPKPATSKPLPHAQTVASSKKPSPAKTAPVAELVPKKQPQESEDESDASPLGKFTKVLGTVWGILEHQGWQVAQGKDTLFCAMPGTQFFNFRPNINVFDSKDKACWKFIATSADVKDDKAKEIARGGDNDSTKLWEILWAVAEKKFGWYTMECGPETWFVKPDTRFEEFQPNETIFQTKKRAVLKCLEIEKVQVELGDSVEGHQVIDFSPKVVGTKKPKEVKETPAKKESAHQATPVSKASASAAASSSSSVKTPSPAVKRKGVKAASASAASSLSTPKASTSVPASASKGRSSGASARATPPKSVTKTPLKSAKKVSARVTSSSSKKLASASKKKGKKKAVVPASPSAREPTQLAFYIPEFKCTFGIVYKKLQDMGWHHRAGKFEYDYFSPEYTAETAILNGNYFQSAAEFEEYLKDSGLWHKIETELREEHAETVEQLRVEARKRLHKQQERKKQIETLKKQRQVDETAKAKQKSLDDVQEAKMKVQETKLAKEKAAYERAVVKAAKEEQRQKAAAAIAAANASNSTARRKSSFANDFLSEFKVSMGKVVKKLVMRGWCYRPGRFEYDYFKPGVTQMKDPILNEDYFQSVAELETYLKISGLWDEIARELREEHYADQEREVMLMSQEEEDAKRTVSAAPKRKSPTAASSAATASPKKVRVAVKEELSVSTASSSSSSMTSRTVLSTSSSSNVKAQIAAEEVEELANDIWANSHHFEFER